MIPPDDDDPDWELTADGSNYEEVQAEGEVLLDELQLEWELEIEDDLMTDRRLMC